MSILIALRLQVANRRQVSGGERIGEVMDIVLVVCRVTGSSHGCGRSRPSVVGVDGAGVVLEGLVVCRVVCLGAGVSGDGRAVAAGGAVRVGDGEVHATFKPAPGQVGGVEQ